jgi:hypothetical protein
VLWHVQDAVLAAENHRGRSARPRGADGLSVDHEWEEDIGLGDLGGGVVRRELGRTSWDLLVHTLR